MSGRNIGIPVISLPASGERLAIELGTQIPSNMPHGEACHVAFEHAVEVAPVIADSLQPIHDNTSFAYVIGRTELATNLSLTEFQHYMRVRTLGVASVFGEVSPDPIEVQQHADATGKKEPTLLAEVTPKPGYEGTQTLSGIVQLELHNENQPEDPPGTPEHLKGLRSVHDTKTDLVVLGVVANEARTTSVVVSQRDVLDTIRRDYPEAFAQLQRPVFRLNRFSSETVQTPRAPEPILRDDGSMYFDFGDMVPLGEAAEKAFSILRDVIGLLAVEFVPHAGDIQVVDNHESPHGRRAIDANAGKRLLYSAHIATRRSTRRPGFIA